MPLPILSARASLPPLPPQLMVNSNRKGLYDVLEGSASTFYNDVSRTGRLNITVIESTEGMGVCFYNSTNGHSIIGLGDQPREDWSFTCNGIRGHLIRKESDFSFFQQE